MKNKNIIASLIALAFCLMPFIGSSAPFQQNRVTTNTDAVVISQVLSNITFPTSVPGVGVGISNSVSGVNNTVTFDFFGIGVLAGKTNFIKLTFSSTPGAADYGSIFIDPTHNGNGVIGPNNVEMEFISPSRVSIIPTSALQIGGRGTGQMATYLNADGTGTPNTLYNSYPLCFFSAWNSNNVEYQWFPSIMSFADSTNSATTGYEYEICIVRDLTNVMSWTPSSLNKRTRFFFGITPGGTGYNRTWFGSSLGSNNTNSFTVDTNQLSIAGNLNFSGSDIPTVAINTNFAGIGATAIVTSGGQNNAFRVEIQAGTLGLLGGTWFHATFSHPFVQTPIIVFSPSGPISNVNSPANCFVQNVTTTGFDYTLTSASGPSVQADIDFVVF